MIRITSETWKYGFSALVVLLIVGSDLVSKYFVQHFLPRGREIPLVTEHLHLVHVHNLGAAFGLFSGLDARIRFLFFTVVIIIASIVLIELIRQTSVKNLSEVTAFAAILGGALGNFINRLTIGHVTDFISVHWKSVYHFPAFNFADIAICLGIGTLLLLNFTKNNNKMLKDSIHA